MLTTALRAGWILTVVAVLEAGAAFLPAVFFMVLVAPRSAKLVEARGARFTLLLGYVFLLLAFLAMLLLWREDPVLAGRAGVRPSSGSEWASPAPRPPTRSRGRCR